MDPRTKIVKLLRLAKDREDSPEGETAARIAGELMEEHDIEVDLDAEDHKDKVRDEWIVEADEPVPWIEMLLLSLADLIYGGVVMPMISPASWKIYIVCDDKDEVDVDLMAYHFAYLQQLIEPLMQPLEAHGTEHEIRSFSMGLVYGITELLFYDMGMEEPTINDMPFVAKSLEAASTFGRGISLDKSIARQHDSFAATMEDNLDIFRDAQPNPQPSSDPQPDLPPPDKVIEPNWTLFQEGRRAAHEHIADPYPPEEQKTGQGKTQKPGPPTQPRHES
jgi:hypothetical protein